MTDLPTGDSKDVEDSKAKKSSCDNVGYKKLKYVGSQTFEQNYLDHYEKNVITDKILLEVILQ